MQIETFEIQCANPAHIKEDIAALFEKKLPSLVIGYANACLPFQDVQHALKRASTPFLVSSSCLGSLLCDSKTVSAKCDLALFCVFDDAGVYGVGSANIDENSAFKAGANALQQALVNAGRPYESPALIWCALPPGNEERILEGFASVVGDQVPIFGGSMADNTVEGNWTTLTREALGAQTIAVVVPSGRGVEYKFFMPQYAKMTYEWQTQGEALYFDLHGEPEGDTSGYFESYAITTAAKMEGSFTTPFAGSHGWYWRNNTDKEITVTLTVAGNYEVIGLKK